MKKDLVTMAASEAARLRTFAEDGAAYREDLRAEIRRLAKLTGQDSLVTFAVETMESLDGLKALRTYMQRRWDAKLPPRPMSVCGQTHDEFKATAEEIETWAALGVTPEQVREIERKTNG